MALIPPDYLDCVAAIGIEGDKGKHWVASAFFYGFPRGEGLYTPMLVTNRHVFEDLQTAWVRINAEATEPAKEFRIPLSDKDGARTWFTHPDPNVDVAVIPVDVENLHVRGARPRFFPGDKQAIRTAEMSAIGTSEGDFVYILGFPLGLAGAERNFVIARGGIIARVRDLLDGKANTFLLDASVFPGNSGGPVVLKPEGMTIMGTKVSNMPYVIGIVHGYVPYEDVAISTQTKRPRVIFQENSGLALVHPVDCIDETCQANLEAIDKVKS
jgi:hypothetical protein